MINKNKPKVGSRGFPTEGARRGRGLEAVGGEYLGETVGCPQNKPAFTLIEMIIVMTIIGLLVLVSVSSYTVVQRQARLDIALDTLISTLKEQRDKARVGKVDKQDTDANTTLSCYGLFFDQKNTDPDIQIVSMRYVTVGNNRADFCDPARSFIKQPSGITTDQGVMVKSVTLGTGQRENIKTFALLFKPPFGTPVFATGFEANALSSSLVLSAGQNPLKINLGLQNVTEEKTLVFDFLTGDIKKLL